MGSGIAPLAPEIGCPPPSNMREILTASRAPFGQKPIPAREDGSAAVDVASPATPGKPATLEVTANAADALAIPRTSRRLSWEPLLAGATITSILPALADDRGVRWKKRSAVTFPALSSKRVD